MNRFTYFGSGFLAGGIFLFVILVKPDFLRDLFRFASTSSTTKTTPTEFTEATQAKRNATAEFDRSVRETIAAARNKREAERRVQTLKTRMNTEREQAKKVAAFLAQDAAFIPVGVIPHPTFQTFRRVHFHPSTGALTVEGRKLSTREARRIIFDSPAERDRVKKR